MASSQGTKLTVGILSLGDMGAGIARLLLARGIPVATNCQGRSEDTVQRAREAKVEMLSSDRALVERCAVILSIVPPRDAEATAERVAIALAGTSEGVRDPVYFVELNAVSPSTCRAMAAMFARAAVPVRFVDGCILGAPPATTGSDPDAEWQLPSIPVSGPHSLASLPGGDGLASALNLRVMSPVIGAASGLKMCFAAMAKGFTALVTQSFTTAHRLGLVDELRRELGDVLPLLLATAQRSVPAFPPKAYRWVREMEEIADTMRDEGNWGVEMFRGAAAVFSAVADDDVLGKEKIGKRKRGTTIEDVAAAMAEGLESKKKEKKKKDKAESAPTPSDDEQLVCSPSVGP